ncbi:MAG: MG2 domain-containing protein [bacterium]
MSNAVDGNESEEPKKSDDNAVTRMKRSLTPNVIIVILSAIIIVGAAYLILSRRGRETVAVSSFAPADEVPQTTNFTVEFSRELVGDSLLNVQLDRLPIGFKPPIPGKFQWIATNKLRFYPDVLLAPSTQYTVEISPRIASGYGYALTGTRQFKFHTPRFRVNSASLTYEVKPETNEEVEFFATIEFNYDVDPEEAVKSIAVEYADGRTIPFQLSTTTPGKIIELQAQRVERSEEEKQIRLRVARGLLCLGGNLGLERDYLKPLVLPGQEDLKIVRMAPKKTAPSKGFIQIQFSLPVDVQNAGQFITVEPPVNIKLIASHHYLELRGDFQMGTTYQVSIRKGLRAIDGSPLERDFSSAVSFRRERIPPQVDFVGEGFYLTRNGNLNVGLSTINVDKVSLEVEKVFANNLVYLLNTTNLAGGRYYRYYNLRALGKRIKSSRIVVQTVENEEVVTPINVKDYLAAERIGVFKLTAHESTRRWNQASKWVIATDLGLLAKKAGEDLWVWVNSLSKLNPVQDVEVKLISQNNQTLMTARTNSDGIAVFKAFKKYTDEFLPYLITASYGEDLSFLELHRRRIPTSDFDVGGASYLEHGYEAFLYNERGVYRPGETAHLAAIVRAENTSVPPSFPVRLQVKGPEGKILSEQRARLNEQGGVEFSVSIPHYVMTGKYVALLLIGDKEEIGRTAFSVEEFVPDRMKVKLTTEKEGYTAGESLQANVEAVTLFGPPAAGRRVQANLEIEARPFSPPRWSSFSFVNRKKSFTKLNFDLGDEILDDNGNYVYTFEIPKDLDPPSSLRGIIETTVLEPGGRGVSAYRGVVIHPHATSVGLRKSKEGYAAPEEATRIDFVVVNPEGEPLAERKVEVSFYRIYWHSILKRDQSRRRYRYVSEQVEDLVRKFTLTSGAVSSSFNVTPPQYGRYRVVARDVDSGASASLWFYASGWGYSPWAMDHPDRIELDLDKEAYSPGETAEIQVRAPFAGKLLLTVEREKVFEYKVVTLEENTATLKMPITAEYKPNVYVSAHLIRSTEDLNRDTPARAFGVVPLSVSTEANHLTVELEAPDEIRPKKRLEVKFQVQGQADSAPYVTIAAVDEGICQLTDFRTPDAHGFFFGKKRLAVDSYDIYGMVLPEITSSLTSVAGDVEAQRKRRLTTVTVRRVKPVAFWSGLVKADRKGRGKVTFDLPQFNGSVRLMAVAFSGDKFGNSQKNVFVREPIVLTPTFPRFISSKDELVIPVNVYNGTGQEATFEVKLAVKGGVQIIGKNTQSVQIAAGKEKQAYFAVKAGETPGKVEFGLSARGAGEKTDLTVAVPLRPPVPFVTLSGSGSLVENTPAAFKFPSDWIQGTTSFSLTISSFPAVQFAGSLQYLLRYPYGCVEQTTSRLFPLLYFNDLARLAEPELFNRNSADYYLEEGIDKLENMQLASGAFSYWPTGEYVSNWSSVYASHFLVEARRAGYVVSDRVYNRLIDALRNFTRSYRSNDSYTYQTAAYACYVLALAGKPDKSTMLYLKNNALDKMREYSKYQLAGAFALSGDLQTSRTLLPRTVVPIKAERRRESGRNFNSSVRAKAIMLDILAEVDDKHPMVPLLVKELTGAASKRMRWYTTQENAFAFVALGKILRKQTGGNYTGTVTIGGELYSKFDTDDQNFSGKDWAGKEAAIAIKGKGTCYYYWRAEGLPSKLTVDEYDHDLLVRRRYLDENGRPIDADSLHQGDLVIAEITVKSLTESLENVATVDLLPAGLEIENPRLQSRKGIDWIGKRAYRPMYMDIRDDRMLLFGNFRYGQTAKFYYGLRAVTQGSFILPPISAEAMYAPSKASVASSGRIVVHGL